MAAPTNSEIEIALRLKDEASASFSKFVNQVQGGSGEAAKSFEQVSKSAGKGEKAVDKLTEAMAEDRVESRRNKFVFGEFSDALRGTDQMLGLAGEGTKDLRKGLGNLIDGAEKGFVAFDQLGPIVGTLGVSGPVGLAIAGIGGLLVLMTELASETEKSAERILTTAESIKALDDAYTEYSAKFKGGDGTAGARKAQMDVAKQDAAALQKTANDMATYVKVWTDEVVQMQAETVNGQWFDDEQLTGKNLLARLRQTMPEVHKIYAEFLAANDGDEEKAQAQFFDEFHNVQARLKAAQAVAMTGIEEAEAKKEQKSKEAYARMAALDIAYISDAQKRRYDEMIKTSETIRRFMEQSEAGRRALVEENNNAFVQQQLSGMKGVAKQEFAQVDAALLEIDDGWKVFLSSVDAGVENLAQNISQGFAQGWEEAFGEANSVLEQFLQAMYSQMVSMLARMAAQKAISGLFSMIPGVGSIFSALSGGAIGGGSNSKLDGRVISPGDMAGAAGAPAGSSPVVVQVNLRGTMSGQRFLQDEMPDYNNYVALKAV